eukprot:jgi/Mesen1/3261/ME000189S02381
MPLLDRLDWAKKKDKQGSTNAPVGSSWRFGKKKGSKGESESPQARPQSSESSSLRDNPSDSLGITSSQASEPEQNVAAVEQGFIGNLGPVNRPESPGEPSQERLLHEGGPSASPSRQSSVTENSVVPQSSQRPRMSVDLSRPPPPLSIPRQSSGTSKGADYPAILQVPRQGSAERDTDVGEQIPRSLSSERYGGGGAVSRSGSGQAIPRSDSGSPTASSASVGWRTPPLVEPPSWSEMSRGSSGLQCPRRGHWTKGPKIGSGGFGSVYKCLNNETGEFFAVKQVPQNSADSAFSAVQSLEQLKSEVTLLSRLQHPNIVQYMGSDMDDEFLYIFLEFVECGSIQKVMAKFPVFSEELIRNYTRQILCGLAYLHDTETIHRDIKGSNILVNTQGRVKLADFGVAKSYSNTVEMTACRGTVWWMAPEAISGQAYDWSVDIWSLGCTVIEMVTRVPPWIDPETGKPPWGQIDQMAAIFKIGRAKGPPPLPGNLSPVAKDFILQCLHIDPAKRPTAANLLYHPFVHTASAGSPQRSLLAPPALSVVQQGASAGGGVSPHGGAGPPVPRIAPRSPGRPTRISSTGSAWSTRQGGPEEAAMAVPAEEDYPPSPVLWKGRGGGSKMESGSPFGPPAPLVSALSLPVGAQLGSLLESNISYRSGGGSGGSGGSSSGGGAALHSDGRYISSDHAYPVHGGGGVMPGGYAGGGHAYPDGAGAGPSAAAAGGYAFYGGAQEGRAGGGGYALYGGAQEVQYSHRPSPPLGGQAPPRSPGRSPGGSLGGSLPWSSSRDREREHSTRGYLEDVEAPPEHHLEYDEHQFSQHPPPPLQQQYQGRRSMDVNLLPRWPTHSMGLTAATPHSPRNTPPHSPPHPNFMYSSQGGSYKSPTHSHQSPLRGRRTRSSIEPLQRPSYHQQGGAGDDFPQVGAYYPHSQSESPSSSMYAQQQQQQQQLWQAQREGVPPPSPADEYHHHHHPAAFPSSHSDSAAVFLRSSYAHPSMASSVVREAGGDSPFAELRSLALEPPPVVIPPARDPRELFTRSPRASPPQVSPDGPLSVPFSSPSQDGSSTGAIGSSSISVVLHKSPPPIYVGAPTPPGEKSPLSKKSEWELFKERQKRSGSGSGSISSTNAGSSTSASPAAVAAAVALAEALPSPGSASGSRLPPGSPIRAAAALGVSARSPLRTPQRSPLASPLGSPKLTGLAIPPLVAAAAAGGAGGGGGGDFLTPPFAYGGPAPGTGTAGDPSSPSGGRGVASAASVTPPRSPRYSERKQPAGGGQWLGGDGDPSSWRKTSSSSWGERSQGVDAGMDYHRQETLDEKYQKAVERRNAESRAQSQDLLLSAIAKLQQL